MSVVLPVRPLAPRPSPRQLVGPRPDALATVSRVGDPGRHGLCHVRPAGLSTGPSHGPHEGQAPVLGQTDTGAPCWHFSGLYRGRHGKAQDGQSGSDADRGVRSTFQMTCLCYWELWSGRCTVDAPGTPHPSPPTCTGLRGSPWVWAGLRPPRRQSTERHGHGVTHTVTSSSYPEPEAPSLTHVPPSSGLRRAGSCWGTVTSGEVASRTHGWPRANSQKEPATPEMRPRPADTMLAPRETLGRGLRHTRLPAPAPRRSTTSAPDAGGLFNSSCRSITLGFKSQLL